ncbi:FAD:protein FMN transferase [Sphingomonas crocodyli]|uniref:FAD:protein FMN transferase n=1 Tax=Sphingomonas crocodyli TaxID=1979270 RepID=UPI0013E33BD8|nr:FAD:protein FMN transferase [Sphingomonas crocodyli]
MDPLVLARRMPHGHVVDIGGATMGTRWSARLVLADPSGADAVRAAMERELATIIAEMSTWEPASLISRFNTAPAGSWFTLPERFFTVLTTALDIAAASGGAFDPTAGALVDIWGFGPGAVDRLPSDGEIADALAQTGWRRIEIDRDARRARQPGGVFLDFSGIAKGFAVDRLSAVARESGIANHLIEIGGELRGEGVKPDGQPWWVELETHPEIECEALRVALCGLCVATSGDYRRHHAIGQNRLPHSIDPRTGQPSASGTGSASVIAADCMTADAEATALSVLDRAAAAEYAERRGLAARLLISGDCDGNEILSAPARAMLDA